VWRLYTCQGTIKASNNEYIISKGAYFKHKKHHGALGKKKKLELSSLIANITIHIPRHVNQHINFVRIRANYWSRQKPWDWHATSQGRVQNSAENVGQIATKLRGLMPKSLYITSSVHLDVDSRHVLLTFLDSEAARMPLALWLAPKQTH